MSYPMVKTLVLTPLLLAASASVALAAGPASSADDLSPGMQEALEQAFQTSQDARLALEDQLRSPLEFSESAPTPAQQAIDSLTRLQSEIRRGARHHSEGFLQASPEAITFCVPTFLSLCLGGRFVVIAAWDSPYDASGAFPAGAIQAGPQSGLLWFSDPTNFEIVIKALNGNCFSSPQNPWVFVAGLTNFEVAIQVRDAITGVIETYHSPAGQAFLPIQDQFTSFPCF